MYVYQKHTDLITLQAQRLTVRHVQVNIFYIKNLPEK